MTIYRSFEGFRDAWHDIKPIRGREEDVRPIGRRNRDWEQIVRVYNPNGEDSYAARLYETNVVTYNHDGSIDLYIGNWPTTSTAKFMSDYLPRMMFATKQKGHIYLCGRHPELSDGCGFRDQLIPPNTVIKIAQEIGENGKRGKWRVKNAPMVEQRVINREAMKQMRESVRPFINFTTTMFKLSDGWVMDATIEEVKKNANIPIYDNLLGHVMSGRAWNYLYEDRLRAKHNEVMEIMRGNDQDKWMFLMYAMLQTVDPVEQRLARTEPENIGTEDNPYMMMRRYFDCKYKLTQYTARITKVLQRCEGVFTTRMVSSDKARSNLVLGK